MIDQFFSRSVLIVLMNSLTAINNVLSYKEPHCKGKGESLLLRPRAVLCLTIPPHEAVATQCKTNLDGVQNIYLYTNLTITRWATLTKHHTHTLTTHTLRHYIPSLQCKRQLRTTDYQLG